MLCSLDSGQIPREITFIYLYALNLFHHSSVQNDTNSSYMRTHEREHDLNNNRDLSQRETSHTDVPQGRDARSCCRPSLSPSRAAVR